MFAYIPTAFSDNTIIEINIELKNIAIDEERKPVSLGEGASFRVGQMKVSSSSEISISDNKFPNKDAQEKYNDIKKQIISGRSVLVDYKLINYEFNDDSRIKDCKCSKQDQENPEQVECNCYRLFDIVWFRYRFDYAFKTENDKWEKSFLIPTNFYFDTPRPATVVGVGDITLSIPGLGFNIDPEINLWNLDQFYRSDTYKIIVTRHTVPKQFILIPEDSIIPKLTSSGAKYEILGKANIGESAIVTVTSPFWYPFDKYSFKFITKTYFDSFLNINFVDIEDLNLETKEELKLKSKKDEIKNFEIKLYRRHNFSNLILPVLLAIVPLLLFFKKEILWARYLTYVSSLGGIYLSLPKTLNIPKINIFTISLCIIFVALYVGFERDMFRSICKTLFMPVLSKLHGLLFSIKMRKIK
ncbi:MAG TPA: hypothetical protein PLU81_01510 [Deltaproteobacteria bacterium]|nr:hypothetical protein [Deltaproteobacteria bacterium]HPR50436.1 hypothetical protein [Deltaproteobacteria bacterium]